MRWFCAVVVLASSSLAVAQDTRTDAQLMEAVRESARLEDWPSAIAVLQVLTERYPTMVSSHVNIAEIQETHLNDPRAALMTIEAIPLEGATEEQIRGIDETKGRLLRLLGRVQATTPGVELRVAEEHCAAPCILAVLPGPQDVSLVKDGDSQEYNVDVAAGQLETVVWIDVRQAAETVPEVLAEPFVEPERRYRPGALTVVGGILTAAGAAGTLGFGLRTNQLEDDFDQAVSAPAVDVQRADALIADGVRMRRATNASIAVLGVGVAMMLLELILDLT